MPIDKITELIKSEVQELQKTVEGKKTLIDKAYKEAIKQAETTKNEALKEFETETKTLAKLQETLKSLTGESSKGKSKGDKPAKPLEVPEDFASAKTANQKILFAVSELGTAYNMDIAEFIAKEEKSDIKKVVSQISSALVTLKNNGTLKSEREGKKFKYSLA